ncbi:MAG: hypothetical protein ACLQNE_15720 [Thermoguttaceae bacterium]
MFVVAGSPITDLRLDPGDDAGQFDVAWIRVDYYLWGRYPKIEPMSTTF